jgi:SAM-dependent methyltransferase
MTEYGQDDLVHQLPRTSIVDRVPWLVDQCRGRGVVHVGFADAGFRDEQQRAGRWLHGRLAEVTSSLVGIDSDARSVEHAVAAGLEAHLADCTDATAVAGLGIAPAEVVLAGEVIEHVDAPGPFLDGLRHLCRDDGRLIVTTPNAYGLVNVAANLIRRVEVNHPDHVLMFTWRTLTELMRRHGWNPVDVFTYVPAVRERGDRSRAEAVAARALLGTERVLGRLGRPFAADGLIVVAEPA